MRLLDHCIKPVFAIEPFSKVRAVKLVVATTIGYAVGDLRPKV
jgi:hypothetical protein